MQVILKEDYPSLGFVGDIVKVKEGFARNYLLPKKIALPANEGNLKLLENRKKVLEVKKAEKKKIAEKYKEQVEAIKVTITHNAEGERLFGSVTLAEIYEELINSGLNIDKKLIKLEAPIKTIGDHKVEIKLHQEVSAYVKVTVEPKIEKKAKATKAKKEEIKTESEVSTEVTEENTASKE